MCSLAQDTRWGRVLVFQPHSTRREQCHEQESCRSHRNLHRSGFACRRHACQTRLHHHRHHAQSRQAGRLAGGGGRAAGGNQSEAAVRHLATTCPYDNIEDEKAHVTLRDGGEKVIEMLEQELNQRLNKAGVLITEARISHLAYAAEIAGAMLQRQQATAIVAARKKIVEGAVGMVEMALAMLSEKDIVVLDDDKKAAMVSNLMVVLCGEKAASPVLNTGSLY